MLTPGVLVSSDSTVTSLIMIANNELQDRSSIRQCVIAQDSDLETFLLLIE